MSYTRRWVLELVVGAKREEDLDRVGERLEELLDVGAIQDVLLEDLVLAGVDAAFILSATVQPDAPPAPDWEELRQAEEGSESRKLMASFAGTPGVRVLPYSAEVEVLEQDGQNRPGAVLWTFQVYVPRGASE